MDTSLSTLDNVSQSKPDQEPPTPSACENLSTAATILDADDNSRLENTHDAVHSQTFDPDKLEMEQRQHLLTERDHVRSALAHVRAAKARATSKSDGNNNDIRRMSMSKQLRDCGAAWHEDAEVLMHICDAELAALPPSVH